MRVLWSALFAYLAVLTGVFLWRTQGLDEPPADAEDFDSLSAAGFVLAALAAALAYYVAFVVHLPCVPEAVAPPPVAVVMRVYERPALRLRQW